MWFVGPDGVGRSQTPCRHWVREGRCGFGDRCRFVHGDAGPARAADGDGRYGPAAAADPSPRAAAAATKCPRFIPGFPDSCPAGARCPLVHDAPGGSAAVSAVTLDSLL